jgi:hypothetical protein
VLCLFSLLVAELQASAAATECSLFLAPSKLPFGPQNSVIAGRSFSLGSLVDSSPSLLIKTKPWMATQLYDYLYEADELGYSYVLFGTTAQLNDDSEGNAKFDWDNDASNRPMKDLRAIAPINLGDEVVTGFNREMRYNCTRPGEDATASCRHSHTESELLEKGHCLSHLYLSESTFPEAGQGVYSKVSYLPGATVHISPVIVLPTHTVRRLSNSTNSTLLNFCLTSPDSDVALLPLGLGAMMNHPLHPASPNVRISWHSWDGSPLPQMLSEGSAPLNLTALELASEPLLNIQYTALREIAPGEELLVSYGEGWEDEWKRQRADVTREGPLLVPLQTDIFPPSFASVCIGRNRVECNLIRNERRIAGNETLQRLQQEGKLLSDRLRSRVLAKQMDPALRKRFNGEIFETTEEPAVCQRRAREVEEEGGGGDGGGS